MAVEEIVVGSLILFFISSFLLSWLSHRVEKKFLKCLSIHEPQVWDELGRPEIFFFESESKKLRLERTSGWDYLKITGGLDEFARGLSNMEGITLFRKFREYARLSKWCLTLSFIIFFGMALIKSS
jgi:hypothetical protein